MAKRGDGAKAKLRRYFLDHVGEKLNHTVLKDVAQGSSEWGRRIRELRQKEGMNIITHNDRQDLKPGEYILLDLTKLPTVERKMSKELRAEILNRDGATCQVCGAVAGEPHPNDGGRKTRLQIGHIIDLSTGGTNDPSNLRAECSVCNEGASNIKLNGPDALKLLTQIRKATRSTQIEVLTWLQKKFPEHRSTV